MNQFSISDLSRYSGIKAHTIRIWEQRYAALQPDRTEGNTRFYNGAQLRRLLNIVSMIDRGYKVSELCSFADKKLLSLVSSTISEEHDNNAEYFVSQLIAAGMSFDEAHFDKIFSACIIRLGIRDSYIKVIYPLLARVGLLWNADSMAPANEHFITNLLRQKFFTAIDALSPPSKSEDKWLLFLPEGEQHEMGLLLASFLIRQSSRPVIYLGNDVPLSSLHDAIKTTKPRYIFSFLVHNDSEKIIDQYIKALSKISEGRKVIIACDVKHVAEKKGGKIIFIHSVNELEELLG